LFITETKLDLLLKVIGMDAERKRNEWMERYLLFELSYFFPSRTLSPFHYIKKPVTTNEAG
jgi:hypothetical protein